jgi:hypothetical protein
MRADCGKDNLFLMIRALMMNDELYVATEKLKNPVKELDEIEE